MDRALPGRMIDLIRDGVHPATLKAKGNKAVWSALMKTAISAQLRGWDAMEWQALLDEPKSHLGRQMRLRDGVKPIAKKTVQRTMDNAWDKAWEWRTSRPEAWSKKEVSEEANRRADAMQDVIADASRDITDNERAVVAYAIEQTRARGLLRVPMPWRSVQQDLGLGERATKNAIRNATRKGLIVLEVAGKASPVEGKRRANLYGLPPATAAPSMCRGTRPMGPPAQTYGTPAA